MGMIETAVAQQKLADFPSLRAFNNIPTASNTGGAVPFNDDSIKGSYSRADAPFTAPWVAMPDGGFPFSNGIAVPTPAISAGVWTDVINFIVPNGYDGVINNISNLYTGSGFVNGSGSLLWRMMMNGSAIRNYDNITTQLGANGTNVTQIRLSSGSLFQFQVTNVSQIGASNQIFCFTGGWFYPTKLGGR